MTQVHSVPFIIALLLSRFSGTEAGNSCEIKGCPKLRAGHINVHLLCHSHNDAGWLNTVDAIYDTAVKSIYDTVLEALQRGRNRRYVSAENVFFSRWWNEQAEPVRHRVRELVKSGQLQFVGGGWTQNDEAVTHYTAVIDQMTLGLRFLNDTFGNDCGVPSVAWQADPFGHSAAQAALFSKMGFSGLMVGRISWDKLAAWKKKAHMGFVWKMASQQEGSTNPGDGEELFTWVPWKSYSTVPGLCFENCPGKDKFTLPWWFLVKHARRLRDAYAADSVPVMLGDDLAWTKADETYQSADELLYRANHIASGFMHVLRWLFRGKKPVNVVYSTPACFLEALHATRSRSWQTFEGDLFPYSDEPERSWTGYYTTRPNLKMMSRYANGFLQACKQLSVLGAGTKKSKVRDLQEALAVMQHHDAITGTSTSFVAEDYAFLLSKGIAGCEEVVDRALSAQPPSSHPALGSHHGNKPRMLRFCHLLNQSRCAATESQHEFEVIVYNPASVSVAPYIRLPVNTLRSSRFFVGGPKATVLEHQLVPLPPLRDERMGRVLTNATAALVFQAQISPLGYSVYRVAYALTPTAPPPGSFLEIERPSVFIENKRYRVEIDPNSGLVARVLLLGGRQNSDDLKHARGRNPPAVLLRQTFAAYKNNEENRFPQPGHYVFGAYREAENMGDKVVHRVVKGPLVQELHQVFDDYISQVVTLHRDSEVIEFTWTIGPTPLIRYPLLGLDVVSRYETDLDSQGFYTDGNGWRNMHRVINFKNEDLPVPSNYYPVTSWIYVEDTRQNLTMAVLPDRPQGGSSLKKGHVELMVHRWHTTNDNLGNGESLSYPELAPKPAHAVARGTHHVFLGSAAETRNFLRPYSLQLVYRPLVAFAAPEFTPTHGDQFSWLQSALPRTVHLLTLEELSPGEVLLRLEHLAIDQHVVEVNVTRLLRGFHLSNVRPVTLAANQFLPGPSRRRWETQEKRGWKRQTEEQLAAPTIRSKLATGDKILYLAPGHIASLVAEIYEKPASRS